MEEQFKKTAAGDVGLDPEQRAARAKATMAALNEALQANRAVMKQIPTVLPCGTSMTELPSRAEAVEKLNELQRLAAQIEQLKPLPAARPVGDARASAQAPSQFRAQKKLRMTI
jgi:hypothetical protein